jgi:3-phosphoshikimate 1-carboxyvinyltransferase
VPGDVSAAAFLIAAAQIVAGSRVDVRRVGPEPDAHGLLDILRDMGGALEAMALGDELGEPVGDLRAGRRASAARAWAASSCPVPSTRSPSSARSRRAPRGRRAIFDAGELRVKESDRLAAMAARAPRLRRALRRAGGRAR